MKAGPSPTSPQGHNQLVVGVAALVEDEDEAAAALAAQLGAERFAVDRIYCSTATRARQTLAPVREALVGTPVTFRDALYMIDLEGLMAFLAALPDTVGSVMMIGHNPTFHELALTLVTRSAPAETEGFRTLKTKFPTGTLCSIACDLPSWSTIAPKCGTLLRFLRPKDLLAE